MSPLLCESVGESVGCILVPMILDLLSIQRTSIIIVFVGPLSVVFAPNLQRWRVKETARHNSETQMAIFKSCCVQKAVKCCICGLLDISIDICIGDWTPLRSMFSQQPVLLNRSLRENLDCIPLAPPQNPLEVKDLWLSQPMGFEKELGIEEDVRSLCLWLSILNQGIACQIPFLLSSLHWCYDQSESAQNSVHSSPCYYRSLSWLQPYLVLVRASFFI